MIIAAQKAHAVDAAFDGSGSGRNDAFVIPNEVRNLYCDA
jgi:hypothetical protein